MRHLEVEHRSLITGLACYLNCDCSCYTRLHPSGAADGVREHRRRRRVPGDVDDDDCGCECASATTTATTTVRRGACTFPIPGSSSSAGRGVGSRGECGAEEPHPLGATARSSRHHHPCRAHRWYGGSSSGGRILGIHIQDDGRTLKCSPQPTGPRHEHTPVLGSNV